MEKSASSARPEQRRSYFTFTPSEELSNIAVSVRSFPVYKLEALKGLSMPVQHIERDTETERPTWVRVSVWDIARALDLADRKTQAQWWYGLNVGMSEVGEDTATVAFGASQGNLEEVFYKSAIQEPN